MMTGCAYVTLLVPSDLIIEPRRRLWLFLHPRLHGIVLDLSTYETVLVK